MNGRARTAVVTPGRPAAGRVMGFTAAGFGPQRRRRAAPRTWNAERVVDSLVAWTARHGRPPRAFEWSPTMGRAVGLLSERPCRWEREYPRWPSYTTVCRYHRDWHAALAAGGLATPRAPRMALEDRVVAARRLAADGHAAATIAAILEVHPTTVRGYLTAGRCPECGGLKVRAEARTCRACRPRHGRWVPFSDEQLLERIRAWTARFGAAPTKGQWRRAELGGHRAWEDEYPAWPSPGAVARRYGSWRAALSAAGVATAVWTPAEMRYALRRFAANVGRPPTAREWARNGDEHPSASMVSDVFGSWNEAVRSAGLAPARHGRWTKDEICAAMRRLADELGRPPAAGDLGRCGGRDPGRTTIRRHYGSLANALRAAGLDPATSIAEPTVAGGRR
jgi:hypothetical protein